MHSCPTAVFLIPHHDKSECGHMHLIYYIKSPVVAANNFASFISTAAKSSIHVFEYTYDEKISGHGAEMILCSSLTQIPKDKGNKDKLVLIFVYYLFKKQYNVSCFVKSSCCLVD